MVSQRTLGVLLQNLTCQINCRLELAPFEVFSHALARLAVGRVGFCDCVPGQKPQAHGERKQDAPFAPAHGDSPSLADWDSLDPIRGATDDSG
jgi:hypothetical protein